MRYSPDTCACFTGHRAMTEDELKRASENTERHIEELYAKGVVNYYVGGAIGFDLAAAVTLLNMRGRYPLLTLNIAIPCPDHMKRWSPAERELFGRVLSRADSVCTVSDEYHRGCMQKRNRYMVDRSSVCIAYMRECKGGTFDTVKYAKKRGLKVVNLAPSPCGEQICLDL